MGRCADGGKVGAMIVIQGLRKCRNHRGYDLQDLFTIPLDNRYIALIFHVGFSTTCFHWFDSPGNLKRELPQARHTSLFIIS
jgi:hypothetical protein